MSEPIYKVHYWPIPFRGCFASYLLAYRDIPFVEATDFDAIVKLMSLEPKDQPIPFMGPPVLEDLRTGRCINQVPAITSFLAQELDLMPADNFAAAMCMKVGMDCNDVLTEICRYNGSMIWERGPWVAWRTERLPRWMSIFQESVARGFIGQRAVNYADIVVFSLFGNMTRCLPELAPDLQQHAPDIAALCDKIGQHPTVAAEVAKHENSYGDLYCDGQIEASLRRMLAQDKAG